jgi:SAM-dependent methyltransferase
VGAVAAWPPASLGPRLYDWECQEVLGRRDQDVAFWLDVVADAAGENAHVLELACGTGRVTLPLAEAGFEVTGLDVDPAALALARQRRGASRWPLLVAADMRQFSLRARFDAVIIPYNSFQLLTDGAAVSACLGAVGQHLAPGGTFGLEVTDFQAGAQRDEVPDEVIATASFDGERLTLSGSLSHDPGRRVSRYRRRFIAERWEVTDEIVLRSYRLDELRAVLETAGFTARRWWSDRAVTRVTAQIG